MSARPEFSFDRPFQATAGLVLSGRRYKHGEPVDWRKLGLTREALYDLWAVGSIDNAPPSAAAIAAPTKPAASPAKPAKPPQPNPLLAPPRR